MFEWLKKIFSAKTQGETGTAAVNEPTNPEAPAQPEVPTEAAAPETEPAAGEETASEELQ
jgi:hypothetical protein